MIKELRKNIKLIIIIVVIVSVFGWVSSYAGTTYAINSNNVEYQDNSGLGVTNVQAAIDGTCTRFNEQLAELKKSMYPVGSVYISTSLSTTSAVAEKLGGTWEVYGTGKVLKGTTGTSGTTGGSNTVKLTTSNLPSHTHSYTPSGSISSIFTGNTTLTQQAGEHRHHLPFAHGSEILYRQYNTSWKDNETGSVASSQIFTSSEGNHQHYFTPSGSVSSTFAGKASTTGSAGKDSASITAVNVEDSYITVYMYRRIA